MTSQSKRTTSRPGRPRGGGLRLRAQPGLGRSARLAGATLLLAGAIGTASAPARAMTLEEAQQIDEGFRLFTEETFDGNGRTCGTCHIPEKNYNIGPADIAALRPSERALVLASNVPGLENPTLVLERALFNVEGGDALHPELSDPPGGGPGHPIFRGSMTVGPLALTIAGPPPPPGPKLGWAANGSPSGGFHHGVPDPDADGSIRAFANGAIAQHNTKTLQRVLGQDFRFATAAELDALEAFQNWLGRRDQFFLRDMTFANARAAAGQALYMSNEASCNVCHFNGGAGLSLNQASPNPIGVNISQHSDVNEEAERLSALTGVHIPEDEGNAVNPPGPPDVFEPEAFNIQPVIESARKEAFFHNHAVITDRRGGGDVPEFEGQGSIEGAITFYFREPFVGSDIHTALQGALSNPVLGDGSGRPHLDTLPAFLNFGGPEAVEELGAFIRALSAYYSLHDCERLLQEAVERIGVGASPQLPAEHCRFNLQDVLDRRRTYRNLYPRVRLKARFLRGMVFLAASRSNVPMLMQLQADVRSLKEEIATLQ